MIVNLNVDNELKKNFRYIELGMTRALEKIIDQIKSYKGKKLNIELKNYPEEINSQQNNNLENSPKSSIKNSPKSLISKPMSVQH